MRRRAGVSVSSYADAVALHHLYAYRHHPRPPSDSQLLGTARQVEGIDIMLAMDVSTSMLAEDLKPNRIEAAKDVAAEFISGDPTTTSV
jgi:Mg-chelatase subunit ChlD